MKTCILGAIGNFRIFAFAVQSVGTGARSGKVSAATGDVTRGPLAPFNPFAYACAYAVIFFLIDPLAIVRLGADALPGDRPVAARNGTFRPIGPFIEANVQVGTLAQFLSGSGALFNFLTNLNAVACSSLCPGAATRGGTFRPFIPFFPVWLTGIAQNGTSLRNRRVSAEMSSQSVAIGRIFAFETSWDR